MFHRRCGVIADTRRDTEGDRVPRGEDGGVDERREQEAEQARQSGGAGARHGRLRPQAHVDTR